MDPSYKKADLFGGAITVNVPSGFADVRPSVNSTIRQVPDHQEVYLSTTGFSSLIFDLGDRVSNTTTDEDALRYHFEDLVDYKDTQKIWHITSEGIRVPHLPSNTPVLTLLATATPPSPPSSSTCNSRPRARAATYVTILMGLVRLVNQNTDIVVTLNIPKMPVGEGGDGEEEVFYDNSGTLRLGKAVQKAKRIMEEVWRTLEVKDWGLFGVE